MRIDKHCFDTTLRITNNKWFPLLFLPIAALFVLIYSYTTSPLFVNEGMDSCVFKTMGLAILQGKVPYVDFFDHKGPILYFINALGQFIIPGRIGIFCIQILWMFFTLLFLYKSATLFLRSDLSFIAVLLTIGILAGIYQEGNQCEEWELLAISISFYFAALFLKKPNLRTLLVGSLIWGVCFGYMFFIRPNDAVSQVGGIMFGIFVWLAIKKDYKVLFKSLLIFIGGFTLVAIPVLSYFIINNALSGLAYGLLQFNAHYSGGIAHLITSCFGHSKLCFFLLFVPIGCMAYNTEYKHILFFLIPTFALSLLLTGTNGFPHYFIVFIPLFLLFWTFLFIQKNLSIILISLSMLYMCSFGSSADYLKGAKNETKCLIQSIRDGDAFHKDFYAQTNKLIRLIPKEDKDDVWNYNLIWHNGTPNFSILYHNEIVQCNKVPYFPMYMVDKKLKEADDIKTNKPKWILVSHEEDRDSLYYNFTSDYKYIYDNYTMVAATDSLHGDIELYRRNY